MRTLLIPVPLLSLLLLQTTPSLGLTNDFSSYPEGSQPCLYDSADEAGCSSGSTGAELNQCLCKNHNNFVYNAAACIARKSPSDANAVYETLSSNCAGTGVTLSVPKQAFLAAASQTTSTSTSTPTSSSTTSPSSSSTSSPTTTSPPGSPDQTSTDNGLSTGAKIGIGLGVGFGVVAAALAAWFIWAYHRRRRSGQSLHSDDISGGGGPGPSYGGAGAFAMASSGSRHEYAQDNTQHGAVELASAAWQPPAGYAPPGYMTSEYKKDGPVGVPLLAELGNESDTRLRPVELPTSPGYLGYSDQAHEQHSLNYGYGHGHGHGHGHGPVTPEGLSPATYSYNGRSGVSPTTPSRSFEGGTY
ncbi:hypothetical protein F5Y14DRAFT_228087 [Nemania sp. NC0429]|nr:hypothetical protein F5Y14DRAFT_228087 [Nemania sp. NC0429]